MKLIKTLILGACASAICTNAEATIRLTDFKNNSQIEMKEITNNGISLVDLKFSGGAQLDKDGAVLESVDGTYRIIFEDAERSGYHRPHWKYHIWLESKEHFPLLSENRILYAVMFYDGEGEIAVKMEENGALTLTGGYDCIDILYPWKVGTIGRGNPYHRIKNHGSDNNGITFFDYDHFVAAPGVNLEDSDAFTHPYDTDGSVK